MGASVRGHLIHMNPGLLSAVLSGAAAIIVAVLSYLLTKRKEREADWRKVKFEHYKEYVAALSGIVEGHATAEGHIRYVHAVNTLTLVASPSVVQALYAYLDYNSARDVAKSLKRHDELLTALLDALRQDVYPLRRRHNDPKTFRLITVPPDMRSPGPAEQ